MASKPNAFTIGNKRSYDIAVPKGAVKIGRRGDYRGGCVWPTRQEAEDYLAKTGGIIQFEDDRPPVACAVYGLMLPNGWDVDVDSSRYPEEGYHRLINGALLLPLDGVE